MMLMFAISIHAQNDVTKFLGIPVDGFKPDMIRALKAKGFASSIYDKDILEGEFNGTRVRVYVVTNNNKVCRIMVCDENTVGETDIKIRFNRLCGQFENNKNYIQLGDDSQKIPDDEKLSYEISINDKRYEAVFYQKSKYDESGVKEELMSAETALEFSLNLQVNLLTTRLEFLRNRYGS